MNRIRIGLMASVLCLAPTVASPAFAENPREERMEHPRINQAIHQLEDAIAYLDAAPHDFGGHKAAALEACHRAVEQLRLAMAFRAREDNRRR